MSYTTGRVIGTHYLVMVAIMVYVSLEVSISKISHIVFSLIYAINTLLLDIMARMLKPLIIGEYMGGIKKLASSNYRKYRANRLLVLKRDQYTCYYCGALEANTVDHLIARKYGRDDSISNMVACCYKCNYAKGSRSERVFLGRLATPPVSPSNLSPNEGIKPLIGPFEGQVKPIWT